MSNREYVDALMTAGRKTDEEVARAIGMTPRMFRMRYKKDNFTLNQFWAICNACNIEVRFIVKRNGADVFDEAEGEGRHVRKLVNGVIYDTDHAAAISNDFSTGGNRELYRDADGNYFFAVYSDDADSIIPCDADDVADFIGANGTKIRNLVIES